MKFLRTIIIVILFLSVFNPVKVSANFIKSTTFLLPYTSDSWDSRDVYGTTIPIDEDNMFIYSGSNGFSRQIGSAIVSANQITKNPDNPILKNNIINSSDLGVEHPSILITNTNNNKIYNIWFNNVNSNARNFTLYYSQSVNGILWNDPQVVQFNNSPFSWEFGGRTAPSIIIDNNSSKYLMWYSAFGFFDNSFTWRIGFADSSDGLLWNNLSQPVLKSLSFWEKINGDFGIASPFVLQLNSLYHMWYHADQDIGHAVSYDGINWVKDPDNPVFSPDPDPTAFDHIRVSDPFVLEKDGKFYMYYTGDSADRKRQIGMAESSDIGFTLPPLASTPTPTPTITPTISPTVTPTPTPTITPTPPFYPIILIPGLGASWNSKALNSCVLTNSDPWKMTPYVSVYKRLINTLTKNAGFKLNSQFYVYNYDWRQDLPIQAQNFKKFIDDISQTAPLNTKFHIVGHSLGGLVIRSYLEDFAGENKIADVITVGSPHEGTVIAYPLWENGEIWSSDLPAKIALNTILSRCRLILSKSKITKLPKLSTKKEILQKVVPSVKSLLPVFDFLTAGKSVIAWNSMTEQNSWLKSHPWPVDLYSLNFYSLSGKNQQTLSYLDVISPSQSDAVKKNWIDGLPVQKYYSSSGDGTVLNTSSSIKGAENFIMPGNHLEIIAQETGIKKILEWLELGSVKVAAQIETPEIRARNTLTFSLDSKVSMRLTDLRLNRIVAENDEFLTFYNPVRGSYLLKLAPSQTGKNTLVSSVLSETSEEINLETEVDFKNLKPRTFTVIYSQAPKPDLRIIPHP